MTPDTPYRLPNHPGSRVVDRFSLVEDLEAEDENGTVPLWLLLQTILATPVASAPQLIDTLDTIANSIRGSSGVAGDYGSLRSLVEQQHDFFSVLWPRIVKYALDLPGLFPAASIKPLRPGDRITLNDEQAASLLAHQFLCTLSPPSWRDDYFDFSIWYASEQRHPDAVRMYMSSVFEYFRNLDPSNEVLHRVEYSLHKCCLDISNAQDTQLSSLYVEVVDKYTTDTQLSSTQGPNGATVVSANKQVGFGQSATQEEIFVGNAPECCPAVLCTPTLGEDVVLVIEGARPMLRIRGQRRDIKWQMLPQESREGGRVLFMDALEIDEAEESEGLADLREENVHRETRKAYAAFASWQGAEETLGGMGKIWSGLWGCGAFNGDPGVKMVIMWMAASMAGKDLVVIIDTSQGDIAQKMKSLIRRVDKEASVRKLRGLLGEMPKHTRRLETLDWLLEATDSGLE